MVKKREVKVFFNNGKNILFRLEKYKQESFFEALHEQYGDNYHRIILYVLDDQKRIIKHMLLYDDKLEEAFANRYRACLYFPEDNKQVIGMIKKKGLHVKEYIHMKSRYDKEIVINMDNIKQLDIEKNKFGNL